MRVEDLTDAQLALRPHRIRGPVAEALLDRGAITPRRAIVYVPDSPAAHRQLGLLRDSGVVLSTADGRCWFDLRRWYITHAHRQRMQALIAGAVALVLALAVTAFYRG